MPVAANTDNGSSSYPQDPNRNQPNQMPERPPRSVHPIADQYQSTSKGSRDDTVERSGRNRGPGGSSSNPGPRPAQVVRQGLPSEHINRGSPVEGPRPREEQAVDVSSDDEYEKVDKPQQVPSKRELSPTADAATSRSRDKKTSERASERSYSQAVDPSAKSSGNGGSKVPLANPETKPSRSDSPTKRATTNLPQGPTDSRYASVVRQNSYMSQPQPPPSSMPNQKLVVSEETRGPSGDAILVDVETLPPDQTPAEMPSPTGADPTQQPRSSQPPPQNAQQEEQRPAQGLFNRFFTGPPRDRATEEKHQMQAYIDNLKRDLHRANKENRHQRQGLQELEQENTRLKENNKALHHELSNSLRELKEAKSLSDIRGKELMGAQVFLTKADSLSISDVIDKVGILNEEIFQAAALYAEGIRPEKREITGAAIEQSLSEVNLALGDQMTKFLHGQGQKYEANAEVNPLIGQAVICIYMVQFCISKLNSWFPADPMLSDFLTSVYGKIRQSEEQAVFGRWRSLIRAHIRPSTEGWSAELLNKFEALSNVASWDVPTDVRKAFISKFDPIFKAIEDLRIALYEKFTSADLEAWTVDPSGPFQPRIMEDAYGDGRKAHESVDGPEIVVGTTGIGLKKLKFRPSGDISYEAVSPPKVVLQSTFKEALEPPPPSKGKSKKRSPPTSDNGGIR